MLRDNEERDRPSEWLRRFQEDPTLYSELVYEAGGMTQAAYRIARARCRAQPVPSSTPTLRELTAACLELRDRMETPTPLPVTRLILQDCRHSGLPVIAPLGREAA